MEMVWQKFSLLENLKLKDRIIIGLILLMTTLAVLTGLVISSIHSVKSQFEIYRHITHENLLWGKIDKELQKVRQATFAYRYSPGEQSVALRNLICRSSLRKRKSWRRR